MAKVNNVVPIDANKVYTIRHPIYRQNSQLWRKWRKTFESGDAYLDAYLYRHSNDEDRLDFNERKKISYVPAFATAGILEVKNSIYQRLCDITRNGGTLSYQNATKGLINGVDLLGAS